MGPSFTSRVALAVLFVFIGTSFSIGDAAARPATSQWTNKEKQVVSRIAWARGKMSGFHNKIKNAKPPGNTLKRGPLAVNAYLSVLRTHASNYRKNTSRSITRSRRSLRRLGRDENAANRKSGLEGHAGRLLRLHKKGLSKMLMHIKGSPDARAIRNSSNAIVSKLNEAIRAAKAL